MKNLDLLIPQSAPEPDRFAWATVTAIDPIRVRLDGEATPLDIDPDSLIDIGWLDVDRRVWCQIHGRRVLILGQSGKDTYVAPTPPDPPDPPVAASLAEVRAGTDDTKFVTSSTFADSPIVSGSINDDDYYEKYPDGRLICAGVYTFPANANTGQSHSWDFPVPFVGRRPQISVVGQSTVPQNFSCGVLNVEIDSVDIRFYRTTSAATGVYYQAEGRWK